MTIETTCRRVLKNTARGGRSAYDGRLQIHRAISLDGDSATADVQKHLRSKLFKLPRDGWVPLKFTPSDWDVLETLQRPSKRQEQGYISMLVAFVEENAERVSAVYKRSNEISAAVLSGDERQLTELNFPWDRIDILSLFHARLFAAEHAHSSGELSDQYRLTMQSTWMRTRFMYAFLGYCLNNVVDSALDHFLTYVLNESYDDLERSVVKLLLRDEVHYSRSFAFKAYVGLMMHPFDACEMFLNHVENVFAESGEIAAEVVTALERLVDAVGDGRLSDLLDVVRRRAVAFAAVPSGTGLARRFGVNGPSLDALKSFVDLRADTPTSPPSYLLEACRMRDKRYPEAIDFDLAVTTFGRWRFLDAGRLLLSLLVSLYMLPRREIAYERKSALRLAKYYGEVLPFMLAAPEGDQLPALLSVILPDDAVDSVLAGPEAYSDRRWLLSVQRDLRRLQQQDQLFDWLSAVRSLLPVKPAYLTGIQWSWFDAIVAARRLQRLRGDPDACYALLLRQIEERTVDSWLRIAIEPLADGKSLDQFLMWLGDTYGDKSTGFVRFFLTPENILLLGLSTNLSGALAGRASALRDNVRRFGFSELLTEKQFEDESRTLTAAILFRDVSGSHFEIAWEIFTRDVSEMERESFSTLRAIADRAEERPLLGMAKIEAPHSFRNGKIAKYEFENRYWPIAQVVISIVDAFMRHPSVGVEVLLSTRFRHDTMRREYEEAFRRASAANIPGMFNDDKVAIVDQLSSFALLFVGHWLNRRMQTARPGKDEALFDFVPTQDQLNGLVQICVAITDFDQIIEIVVGWLKLQLETQVEVARVSFDRELRRGVADAIAEERSRLLANYQYREEDVRRAAAMLTTVASQKSDELLSWFSAENLKGRGSMSIEDLKVAADGLFEAAEARGALAVRCLASSELEIEFPPDQARLMFDLITEAFTNAMKYGPEAGVRVRLSACRNERGPWLRFSSTADLDGRRDWEVTGERYLSASDTIFGEGSSGLGKIAALSATISQRKTTVFAHRRSRSFHLFVPLPTQA